jgi:hypothetical protein
MLLNFEKRFVPHVEDGSKTHTIRAERKRAPKVGETCHCYTGLRHKGARLLGRWPCVKVERITVTPHELRIDGEVLSRDERDAFARRDGFRGPQPWAEMMRYWEHEQPSAGEWRFDGYVIHWRYTGATAHSAA